MIAVVAVVAVVAVAVVIMSSDDEKSGGLDSLQDIDEGDMIQYSVTDGLSTIKYKYSIVEIVEDETTHELEYTYE